MYQICYAHNNAIELLLTTNGGFRVQVVSGDSAKELALRSSRSLLAVTRQVENYASGGRTTPCNPRTVHHQWLTDMPPARRLLGNRALYPLSPMALKSMRARTGLHAPLPPCPHAVCEWPADCSSRGHTVHPMAPVWSSSCHRCHEEVTYDVSADGFMYVTGVHCRQCNMALCGHCLRVCGWTCGCGRRVALSDRDKIASCEQK